MNELEGVNTLDDLEKQPEREALREAARRRALIVEDAKDMAVFYETLIANAESIGAEEAAKITAAYIFVLFNQQPEDEQEED